MDDSDDVILYLLPHKGEGFRDALAATRAAENKSRFLAARGSDVVKPRETPHRQERAGTELSYERGTFEHTDHLVVRFSDGARTRVGVVAGRSPEADITIKEGTDISTFHLAFTFDEQNRPIVRDLGSTGGTKLTYNGEEGERRSNFDWLLQGPSIVKDTPPVLNIADHVQFKVIMPPRDITSPDYIDRVKKFRETTADPDELLSSLIIQSTQSTRLPTGQRTPLESPQPVLFKENIGEGGYGTVKYLWNVTTGDEYVAKTPLSVLIKTKKVKIEHWRTEADIMKSITHDHIVEFRNATFDSWPQLEFEYVPGGSLDTYDDLSTFESTQILYQLSSALYYLHSRNPSIGHRDIKPANILVKKRGVDGISVKLSDFGLSKKADTMKTLCGTREFLAPELYLKAADRKATANDKYGVVVDIWSLGLVVVWIECGLPNFKEGWESDPMAWPRALIKHANNHYKKQGSDLLYMIIDNMLIEEPDERSSADYCRDQAAQLLESTNDTPRQGSDRDYDDGSASELPEEARVVETVESINSSLIADLGYRDESLIDSLVNPTESDASELPEEARVVETVESINSSLIADLGYRDESLTDSLVNPTESEERQRAGGAPSPDTQPSQVLETSSPRLQ
ncbi:kinase-like domain-containing protein [Xylaria longipes]|nr:kinase-like domain-containing protein [Xylaria longipes]